MDSTDATVQWTRLSLAGMHILQLPPSTAPPSSSTNSFPPLAASAIRCGGGGGQVVMCARARVCGCVGGVGGTLQTRRGAANYTHSLTHTHTHTHKTRGREPHPRGCAGHAHAECTPLKQKKRFDSKKAYPFMIWEIDRHHPPHTHTHTLSLTLVNPRGKNRSRPRVAVDQSLSEPPSVHGSLSQS